MFNSYLSQLLVLLLIMLCCLRVFFVRNSKVDAAASLAPCAFAVSIASIFVWEVSIPNLFLLALSFLVFAANVRALFRLSARLYIDRYSGSFVIFSIIELALAACALVFIILGRPVRLEPGSFSSVKTVSRIGGNLSRGFRTLPARDFFYRSTGRLYTFSPDSKALENEAPEHKDSSPIVLFCGTEIAEVCDYEPYLLLLSQKGYTVAAADFYSRDIEYYEGVLNLRFIRKFVARNGIAEARKADSAECAQNIVKSYKALFSLVRELYGEDRMFYFVFDNLDFDSVSSVLDYASGSQAGFFVLSRVSEYKTPGLGFAEQTDIPLAKEKGLARDKTLFIPRYAALKTIESLSAFKADTALPSLENVSESN